MACITQEVRLDDHNRSLLALKSMNPRLGVGVAFLAVDVTSYSLHFSLRVSQPVNDPFGKDMIDSHKLGLQLLEAAFCEEYTTEKQ